jgi:hypothetical protein
MFSGTTIDLSLLSSLAKRRRISFSEALGHEFIGPLKPVPFNSSFLIKQLDLA